MATIKVQREFMPALDKHYSILTVVLGRAAGAVGCWLARLYAPFVRSVWQEEFNRTRNGSGNGSIPESLRQRPGMLMPEPGHMVDKEAFPHFFFFLLWSQKTLPITFLWIGTRLFLRYSRQVCDIIPEKHYESNHFLIFLFHPSLFHLDFLLCRLIKVKCNVTTVISQTGKVRSLTIGNCWRQIVWCHVL